MSLIVHKSVSPSPSSPLWYLKYSYLAGQQAVQDRPLLRLPFKLICRLHDFKSVCVKKCMCMSKYVFVYTFLYSGMADYSGSFLWSVDSKQTFFIHLQRKDSIISKFHGPGVHRPLSTLCITDLHRHFRGRHSRKRRRSVHLFLLQTSNMCLDVFLTQHSQM